MLIILWGIYEAEPPNTLIAIFSYQTEVARYFGKTKSAICHSIKRGTEVKYKDKKYVVEKIEFDDEEDI